MAKLKTNKAARKRFSRTASGRFKRRRSALRHILTTKSRGRKRHLRRGALVAPADHAAISRLLPYG